MASTRVIVLRKRRLSRGELDLCRKSLATGGLIVFPTDTVYGLACNAFHAEAVHEVYRVKGRSTTKPLPVFLADVEQLPLVAKEILPEARSLIKAFWPGALTLVFKTAPLALHATRGKSTIAVRIPDAPLVNALLSELPFPLAVTSANTSNRPSLTLGVQARKFFKGKVDVIIDSGGCRLGRESTIVDATHFPFTVLREGAISKQAILDAI